MSKCTIINAECPRTNDAGKKRFCPAWTDGLVWTNIATGEERIVNCSFEMLPNMIIEVIKASNRPAHAVESTRNEIVRGFAHLYSALNMEPANGSEETPPAISGNGHKAISDV